MISFLGKMNNFGSEKSSKQIPVHILRVIFVSLCVILGMILFAFMGNSHEPALYGPSILSWLARQWLDPGSKSGHGWLVPMVSLTIVWLKRRELAAVKQGTDSRALPVIVIALILYWAGYRSQQPRFGVICLISLLWGIPFYLWGIGVAKILIFPCSYLIFAVPMGFLTSFTFPLRLLSCATSVALLNGLGIAAIRSGTAILSEGPDGFALDIADPCSGLQSLIAMTALTAAYAYLTQKGLLKKWILFLAAVPLAMAGNIVRIVTIATAAKTFGGDIAMKIYHDYSGYIIFAAAIILMTALGALLNKDFRSTVKRWISETSNRT